MSDRDAEVLALKRQAIAFKREGRLEEAKACLLQVRALELDGLTADDLDDPVELKKLALHFKHQNKIEEAKAALLKAKRLEAAAAEPPPSQAEGGSPGPRLAPLPAPGAAAAKAQSERASAGTEESSARRPSPLQASAREAPPTPPAPPAPPAQVATGALPPPPPYHASGAGRKPAAPTPPTSDTWPQSPDLADAPAGHNRDHHKEDDDEGDIAEADVGSDVDDPDLLAEYAAMQQSESGDNSPKEPSGASEAHEAGSEDEHVDETDPDLLAEYAMLGDTSEPADGHTGASDEENGENHLSDQVATDLEMAAAADDDDEEEEEEEGHAGSGDATFSLQEMLDIDMIVEMFQAEMPVPTEELYATRALEYKKRALVLKKAGDIEKAKDALRTSKALEMTAAKLLAMLASSQGSAGDDGDFELGEDGMVNADDMGGLSEEELDNPELLADMIKVGMASPDPDRFRAAAEAKKIEALRFKRAGDIAQATAALREFKVLQARAASIAKALQIANGAEGGGGELNFEALEAQAAAEAKPARAGTKSTAQGTKSASAANGQSGPPTSTAKRAGADQSASAGSSAPKRSAQELKQVALELHKAGKKEEATTAYKLYKSALEAESKAATQEISMRIRDQLKSELALATEQRRLFEFHELFGTNPAQARKRQAEWTEYGRKCGAAIGQLASLASDDSSQLRVVHDSAAPKLAKVANGLEWLDAEADLSDPRLHIGVVSVVNLSKNPAFEELGEAATADSIRVDVSIQLPPSPNAADETIELSLSPPDSASTKAVGTMLRLMKTTAVDLPRGDDRFARMVLRRMARKKIIFSVVHVPPVKARKSWFGFGHHQEPPPEPVLLGRVAVDLSLLTTKASEAGDLTLMDRAGRRAVGGTLRVGVRTSRPYGPEASGSPTGEQMVLVEHEPLRLAKD